MKPETAELLKKHLSDNKFELAPSPEGLAFNYELTDDEVTKIVEAEYGPNLVGSVDELFKTIVKKLIKLGADHATKNGKEESK